MAKKIIRFDNQRGEALHTEASRTVFDNAGSGMSSTTVQDALCELAARPHGGGGNAPVESVEVVNNLVDGGQEKALSAEQGVVLKGMIDDLGDAVPGVTDSAVPGDGRCLSSGGAFSTVHSPTAAEFTAGKMYYYTSSSRVSLGDKFSTGQSNASTMSTSSIPVHAGDTVELYGQPYTSSYYLWVLVDATGGVVSLPTLGEGHEPESPGVIAIAQDGILYISAKSASCGATLWRPIKEELEEELEALSDQVSTALSTLSSSAGVTAHNTVRMTKTWWDTNVKRKTYFNTADNTHYIIADTAENLCGTPTLNAKIVFGKNCILSAEPGCMLGDYVDLHFDRTLIAVGQQQIFTTPTFAFIPSLVGQIVYGTRVITKGTFANGQILPEWWGAKPGEGPIDNYSHHNAGTIAQGIVNANAINYALSVAGDAEVYLPGAKYVVSATITVGPLWSTGSAVWGKLLPSQNNDSCKDAELHGNRNVKLRVVGSLIATDEFQGYNPKLSGCVSSGGVFTGQYSEAYHCEIPAVVFVNGTAPQVNIGGAIVVPYSAQDRVIVTSDSVPANLDASDLGKIYFVGTSGNYDVWLPYGHYTGEDEWDDDYEQFIPDVCIRKVGHSDATEGDISKFSNKSKNTLCGRNGKMTGMYALYLAYIFGADIRVKRLMKGEDRGGFWNLDARGELMSYRYRTEVLHMGECAGVNFGVAQAADVHIDQIVGFNDGVCYERIYAGSAYTYVQHCRFNFGNIMCNNAIHVTVGRGCHHSMMNRNTDAGCYFNACVWHIGGSQALCAGSNTYSSPFIPTTLRSTFLLSESSGDDGSDYYGSGWQGKGNYGSSRGFGQHEIHLEPGPDNLYVCLYDLTHANSNIITSRSNINGDTGRIMLWRKGSRWINSEVGYGILLGRRVKGEASEDAWYPLHTFVGHSSLYGQGEPVNYAHLSALQDVPYGGNSNLARKIWADANYDLGYDAFLFPHGESANGPYSEVVGFPFSSSYRFINFTACSDNIIDNGGHDVLVYEAVAADLKSWHNELIGCQSRYAAYEQGRSTTGCNAGDMTYGNWTVRNPYMPFFKKVRFDVANAPMLCGYGGGTAYRVMFPDDFTASKMIFVAQAPTTSSDNGLYVVLSGSVSTGKTYGGQRLYPMYLVYDFLMNSDVFFRPSDTVQKKCEQIGWYSDEFGLLKARDAIIDAITGAQDFASAKTALQALRTSTSGS